MAEEHELDPITKLSVSYDALVKEFADFKDSRSKDVELMNGLIESNKRLFAMVSSTSGNAQEPASKSEKDKMEDSFVAGVMRGFGVKESD